MAALALSLLVFPGTGHFVFKRWIRGVVWMAVFGAILMSILGAAAPMMSKMTDSMMSPTGDVVFDYKVLGFIAGMGAASFVVWGLAALDILWISRSAPVKAPASVSESPAEPQPATAP